MERLEYYRAADGRMLPKQNQRQFVLILGGLLGIILVILTVLAYQSTRPRQPETRMQVMAAQIFVRAELQPTAEDHINFSPPEEMDVSSQGNDRYLVRGWVDQISAEGQTRRFDFACTIRKEPSGDWVREQLTLFPQS